MEDQFWLLKSPASQLKLAEWDHHKVQTARVICPANAGHQRGGKRLNNLSVVLPNTPIEAFVWTWQSQLLLQDRTLKLLRKGGFTGFEVKPITAGYKKTSAKPPKLWELILTGWAGMASPASGIHLDEAGSCEICGLLHYTKVIHPEFLIDKSRWDGSDFFMVWPLPSHVFVTQKVIRLIREENLTGVQIGRVSDIPSNNYGFGPGRLSYYMPDNRARELGEPLGIY